MAERLLRNPMLGLKKKNRVSCLNGVFPRALQGPQVRSLARELRSCTL